MKHLDTWKLFESKLTDLAMLIAKSDNEKFKKQIDNSIKTKVASIFMEQFNEWLKQKLPETYYKQFVLFDSKDYTICFSTEVRDRQLPVNSSWQLYNGVMIRYASLPFKKKTLHLKLVPDIRVLRNTNLEKILINKQIRINGKIERIRSCKNIPLCDLETIIENISTDVNLLFKKEFFESLYQQIINQLVDHSVNRIIDVFELFFLENEEEVRFYSIKDFFIKVQNYHEVLKKTFPELENSIINKTASILKDSDIISEFTPKQLSQIRNLSKEIFDALKSKQDLKNQWATDLQADAGEYGL